MLFLTFSLSELIDEFKLGEHYQLLDNLIDLSNRGNGCCALRRMPDFRLQYTATGTASCFILSTEREEDR